MKHTLLRRLGHFVARWPFLCLGLLTFGAFLAVEAYGMPRGMQQPLRLLIVPLWAMRTLQMLVRIGYLPGPFQLLIALPTLFLPYVLADWLLRRIRQSWRMRPAAAI